MPVIPVIFILYCQALSSHKLQTQCQTLIWLIDPMPIIVKHYYLYKDNTVTYFLDFFEIIYQLYQFRGCFLKDTGRNGGRNLGTFTNVTSEYQCQMKCQENEECEYFVYKKSQFECKLTNKSASPIKRVGHLFGPKYC